MKAPDEPDPLDEIAQACSDIGRHPGLPPPKHAAAVERVRALSVWQQYRGQGRIELFRAACWLTLAQPSMFTRADLERTRDKRLELADWLTLDADAWVLVGDVDKARKLREAAEVYYREAAQVREVGITEKAIERKRDPQGQACCIRLSKVCHIHFGRWMDETVATIANAILDRRDITKRKVVEWRNVNHLVVTVKSRKKPT